MKLWIHFQVADWLLLEQQYIHSHFALAGLHRNSGRNQIGMLAGFTAERCPVSRRNGGRFGSEYA